MPPSNPPKHIAVVLFPGFQLLDIAGPLDVLNILSKEQPLTLSILAATLDPVSTSTQASTSQPFAQSIVPTHTFAAAPTDIDVLVVPGGLGTREAANIAPVIEFVRRVYGTGLQYLLTVCTGSAVVGMAGVLDGRRATSNKKAFTWVKEVAPAVQWVPKARWVVDGNVWTSSGISAGIDLIYAWVGEVWGEEVADLIADSSEYERNRDASGDRFAERWGVV